MKDTNEKPLLLKLVKSQHRQLVAPLTFSAYAPLLQDPNTSVFALQSGFLDKKPHFVGLSVGYFAGEEGKILSLYVQPLYRGRGLAHLLIENLVKDLQEKRAKMVGVSYMQKPILDHLFTKFGFEKPVEKMRVLHFDSKTMRRTRWVRNIPLPSKYQLFPLAEATGKDQQKMQEIFGRKDFPKELRFTKNPETIEKISSTGERKNAILIGRLATHKVAPKTIRYTSLYVDENNRLIPIALMTTAIRNHCEKAVDDPFAIQGVLTNYPKMQILAKRKLEPLANKVAISVDRTLFL